MNPRDKDLLHLSVTDPEVPQHVRKEWRDQGFEFPLVEVPTGEVWLLVEDRGQPIDLAAVTADDVGSALRWADPRTGKVHFGDYVACEWERGIIIGRFTDTEPGHAVNGYAFLPARVCFWEYGTD